MMIYMVVVVVIVIINTSIIYGVAVMHQVVQALFYSFVYYYFIAIP